MKRIELVGAVNVTPDSFSDGGLYIHPEIAIARTHEYFIEGASLVDIGGESTRPDGTPISTYGFRENNQTE